MFKKLQSMVRNKVKTFLIVNYKDESNCKVYNVNLN